MESPLPALPADDSYHVTVGSGDSHTAFGALSLLSLA